MTGLCFVHTCIDVLIQALNSTLFRFFLLQEAQHATTKCDYRDKPGAMRLAATVYIAGKASLCYAFAYVVPIITMH